MRSAVLAIFSVVYVWPLLLLLVGSFQQDGWDNYRQVWRRVDFPSLFCHSVWVSSVTVVVGGLVNSLAGYALARLRFRGRYPLLAAILVAMVIPFEAVAVPLFFCISKLGLRDCLTMQALPFVASAFSIGLFYTSYLEFPAELEEAARLDGANAWQVYFRVVLPNSGPALATHSVTTLLSSWGAYLWPLLITAGPEARPLALALPIFLASPPIHWGQIFAFGILMVLPLALAFLFLQTYFRPAGWTSGIK